MTTSRPVQLRFMSLVCAGLTTSGAVMVTKAVRTGADDPLGFWFWIVFMGLGTLVFAALTGAFWWASGKEEKVDAIVARRNIPLDRAVRATQDPEA